MVTLVLRRLRVILNVVTGVCIGLMVCCSLLHWFSVEEVYRSYNALYTGIQSGKPRMEESYLSDLKRVNQDIIGWIAIEGTAIDQPVVQGEDNYTYLHQNIYKEQSLAGSLFMDMRCDKSFQEGYHLIYGHHMSDHQMLADLDLFLDEDFFEENREGVLFGEDESYTLRTAAVLEVEQDDPWIFSPIACNEKMDVFQRYIGDKALYLHEENLNGRLVALSTCSRKLESQRIVLILSICDQMSS